MRAVLVAALFCSCTADEGVRRVVPSYIEATYGEGNQFGSIGQRNSFDTDASYAAVTLGWHVQSIPVSFDTSPAWWDRNRIADALPVQDVAAQKSAEDLEEIRATIKRLEQELAGVWGPLETIISALMAAGLGAGGVAFMKRKKETE